MTQDTGRQIIMLKTAVYLTAIPALLVVTAVGLALLPLIALLWRLDQSRPAPPPVLTAIQQSAPR